MWAWMAPDVEWTTLWVSDWWDLPLGELERLEMEYAMHWARRGYRQGRTLTRTVTVLPSVQAA